MLRVRIVVAQQGLHFPNLHAVVDPAFDFADPVDIASLKGDAHRRFSAV
jgi:hypothetical protein